ncbi:uncharacterized protein LOC133927968 [Phragmites australis]|uniref:uncharacterized protein LOC133927968 n=1 Tax=Phragmites australis TaxID=29695 RepID=UPI002D779FAD|nr:uncharacterized protein LOC133927968 [Phragmites australis]
MLELKAGVEPFHGITLKSLTMPLGQIGLPITFDVPDNFHTHRLTFDVADFETTYNGDQRAAFKCDKQSLEIMEHFCQMMTTTKDMESKHQKCQATGKIKDSANNSKLLSLTDTSKSDDTTKGEADEGAKDKKAGGGTKTVTLDPSELTKSIRIGVDLDPK